MMKGIKYALSFVFGAVYASSIWSLVLFGGKEGANWIMFPTLVVLFGAMGIVFGVIAWLYDNWNSE